MQSPIISRYLACDLILNFHRVVCNAVTEKNSGNALCFASFLHAQAVPKISSLQYHQALFHREQRTPKKKTLVGTFSFEDIVCNYL